MVRRCLALLLLALAGCPQPGPQVTTARKTTAPVAQPSPAEKSAASPGGSPEDGEQGMGLAMLTPTGELLGPEGGWDAARIEVRDDRGMSGYTLIVLQGDGRGLRRKVEAYRDEVREKLQLPPERVRELLRRCSAADLKQYGSIPHPPDGSYVGMTLSGPGGKWQVTCATGKVPAALEEIAQACREAAAQAKATQEHEGPMQEGYAVPTPLD
ncbi:MAG: hypothetical protein AB7N76_18230 [Planctomycetota bacterium]